MMNFMRSEQLVKELGEYFQQKRVQAGLSQLEVAKSLEYRSAQFVSNWERGLTTPPMKKMGSLIRLTKADPEEVLQLIMKHQEQILTDILYGKAKVQ